MTPAMSFFHGRLGRQANEGFRSDDFSGGVPVVPGATPDRQVHPALVRRHSGGLDDVHVVFPIEPK